MGMQENGKLQMFENQPIRTAWDEEQEEWYFSVVDVVGALTESADPTAYWRKLKQRLKAEGNETVTNCHGLKMKAADRYSGNLRVRKAKAKRKPCSAKRWRITKKRNS